MKNFYFTFGKVHKLASGESLANCYCPVYANNKAEAVRKITEVRGNQWASCYEDKNAAGVKKFGLTEVKLELIKIY